MGRGKRPKNPDKKARVPGSGGAAAGTGGAGGAEGGGGTIEEDVLRWRFELSTEKAQKNWQGREVWAKVERSAVYIELLGVGTLGRVPDPPAAAIIKAAKRGRLAGRILKVKNANLLDIELWASKS